MILGQSGAGKTTALNILGGMDTATSGRVVVGGRDITGLRPKELVGYRRNDIGFVFQFYNLVPNLTALENVELASQICPDHFDPADTLGKVGLADRLDNFLRSCPAASQRVSIARAIAKKPKLLLCDEPTGALDYETGKEVLQLLQDICRDEGMTVMIITHNSALAPMAHKVIRFRSARRPARRSTSIRCRSPTSNGRTVVAMSVKHSVKHSRRSVKQPVKHVALAYVKDTTRSWLRGWKRFLSIAVISLLGVSVLTGIYAGCRDMFLAADGSTTDRDCTTSRSSPPTA